MVTDANQTYCDDHFAINTNIESLCGTPETNIMLCYINFVSIKKKKKNALLNTARQIYEDFSNKGPYPGKCMKHKSGN